MGNDGRDIIFELADVGNTGRDGSFQMVVCPSFVAVCAHLKYTVETDGRDGIVELADAGNTSKDRTFSQLRRKRWQVRCV